MIRQQMKAVPEDETIVLVATGQYIGEGIYQTSESSSGERSSDCGVYAVARALSGEPHRNYPKACQGVGAGGNKFCMSTTQ